ncbi:unnamed protein product [Cylicocyclus nassatus]|uniref:WAP domain-containing protein n=1 Tax=Cylicocyclus nassatus TaxID=53992 RepID=A0AA36M623_CYLNA|nr:unnamed protein product [Cylicocyclus nassatus]
MYVLIVAYIIVISGLTAGQFGNEPALSLTASKGISNPPIPSQSPDTIQPPLHPLKKDCLDRDCPESYVCMAGSCVTGKRCRTKSDCKNGLHCVKTLCMRVVFKSLQNFKKPRWFSRV